MKPEQIIHFTENYFSALCRPGTQWPSLGIYCRSSVPDRKLLNAKKKYAKYNPAEESALLLIDDSLWGTARKGFVMTESKIYYSLANHDNDTIITGAASGILSLDKVKSILFEEKTLSTCVIVNGAQFANITYISRAEINILNDFFHKLFSKSATEPDAPQKKLNNERSDWYYEKEGRQIGPVSVEEIKASIETGFLSYGSMVWERGSPGWVKLENSALQHLLPGDVLPPLNVRESLTVSPGGFGAKRCVTVITFVLIMAGISFNFYKSYKYANKYSYSTADRYNAGVGYFITLGIAPQNGTALVKKLNLWGPKEIHESKEMLELKRKGHEDFGAALEYLKRRNKQ